MQRACASCGRLYEAKRPSSTYCGATCRQRAKRAGDAGRPTKAIPGTKPAKAAKAVPLPPQTTGLEAATRRELEQADRLDTMLGQTAIELARRISSSFETGSAVASLTKQLRETMAEALQGVAQAADPLDELRARRDGKRRNAG